MTETKLKELLKRIEDGTATDEEKAFIEGWLLQYSDGSDKAYQPAEILADAGIVWDNITPRKLTPATKSMWPRIAAAASIILVLATGGYIVLQKQAAQKQMVTNIERLVPRQSGLVLTLNTGKKIALDPAAHGNTRVADGTQLHQKNGEISYDAGKANSNELFTHTLTNNSGNKYSLILADGTEAYLDAQSSITYPTSFKGKQREVSVTGQAYFKVKHSAAHPFLVHVKNQTIEDIGTEFNIRAYEGEAATTLVEGSARVLLNPTGKDVLLIPGQQTVVSGNKLVVKEADLEETVDWLQGKLIFSHRQLGDILADVSRIYGVQFSWQNDGLKDIKFNGAVSRTRKLAAILAFFRNTGKVNFLIQDNHVQVIEAQ
ncbi:FecR family protein [Mucilaginibacter terrigena]|uniref:FecR family protein n=1 Tax=Mucilaginibacter terrigena TaxID=2492395 RepID=A0A4Q5LRQ7_9SPHI|nr:FecR family protein [Mucilaginibacter terrigena]RYU92165.1 FecR family protein [Mucilaginibacter terrigena]